MFFSIKLGRRLLVQLEIFIREPLGDRNIDEASVPFDVF